MNEKKFKHLDYIQENIKRMSNNSFIIKGWTISIISILFIFSNKEMNKSYLLITLLAVLVFWYLNGFFLQQERKFRALYDKVRIQSESEIDFSMSTDEFKSRDFYLIGNIFSKSIFPLYLVIIIMILIGNQI